jgi:hypothetical protein
VLLDLVMSLRIEDVSWCFSGADCFEHVIKVGDRLGIILPAKDIAFFTNSSIMRVNPLPLPIESKSNQLSYVV